MHPPLGLRLGRWTCQGGGSLAALTPPASAWFGTVDVAPQMKKARELPGLRWCPIARPSPQEEQLARLDEITRLQPVDIDAARQTAGLEPHLIVSRFLFTLSESRHLLSEHVVDYQLHIRPAGQAVADRRTRIEGVRVVLAQRKSLGKNGYHSGSTEWVPIA